MKKRILYIVTQSEWGGAQVYVYGLVTKLPKDTFEIAVASGKSASNELTNKLVSKQIQTFKLTRLGRSIQPIADLLAIIELYKLMKSFRPDIVHLNSSKVSIVGSIAAKFAKVPKVIYTAHGWVFNEPNHWWVNLLYYILERFTAKYKDAIICVSEYDKNVAIRKNILPKGTLTAIHNGIDMQTLNFYDKETARELLSEKIKSQLPSHQKIVGTIGNLYRTKGHAILVDAAKDTPDSFFIVIGEGREREHLERLIKKSGLDKRFILVGSIQNAYQYLKAFDIFVLPSLKEGFPYIILEALAARIPIVSTNVGGIPEIIETKNLVPPNNKDALADALSATPDTPHFSEKSITIDVMISKTQSLYLKD